jgi:His-Xaa-Ser system protein HxsD
LTSPHIKEAAVRSQVVLFDPQAVSTDAVQRAVYRLSDRLSVDICAGEVIECTVHAADVSEMEPLLAEFRNEVLDHVLRERIRDETAAARNVILALAFANTGVVPAE